MLQFSTEFQKFLDVNNFIIIDSLFDGRVKKYKSESLALRIVQDSNLTQSIAITANENVDEWYDLGLVSTFIYDNDDYLKGLAFEEECTFLIKDYNTILKLFNNQNYPNTYQNLTELEKQRGDILF